MAKKKVVPEPAPVALPLSFWENEQGAAAIEKIKAAGHLVFPCKRPGQDAHSQDYVGVALDNGKNWKNPCANYSDVQVFNLQELVLLAEQGHLAVQGQRDEHDRQTNTRHHRIYWQDGSDEVIVPTGMLVPYGFSRNRLEERFLADGVRALYVTEFNPFAADVVTARLKPVYGYWLWNEDKGEEFLVVLRPSHESPVKLPSNWKRTI